MDTGERFLLGVNYWPRRKAMYWWSDVDLGEVRDEFAVIRGLGLDVVRLFLLWDDFQPAPDAASRPRLRWPPRRAVQHAPTADEYYAAPRDHCVRLYEEYLAD